MKKKVKTNQGRTRNVFLNVGSNFIEYFIKALFTFITRTVFIYYLGKEALGLNGLFTNILSMLSLVELGVGAAINFGLYKPLADKDDKKISALMNFYRKTYRKVGISVIIIGGFLTFFLKYLISDIDAIENVYIIYILYLLNTATSYFISYKETLITADQKKYKIVPIEITFLFLLNLLQIIFLVLTKNFIVYLFIQLIVQFLQRLVTNIFITKQYKNINFNTTDQLDEKDMLVIKKNVKAMFFHKIGDYCINGTDNLIISSFINIVTVGLYSNYLTITTLINSFISMIYNNLVSSLGNLIVEGDTNKKIDVFKKMDFIAFCLYGLSFVILINIFNDFILLWVGKDYQLNFSIVLALLLSFYITGMRVPSSTAKMAAGVYDADKFTPIIQSIVNLVVSIFLVKRIGLLGVIIGTIVSSLVLPNWQRPYLVYKYVLNTSSKSYFLNKLKYIFILFISSFLTLSFFRYINIGNLLVVITTKIVFVLCVFFLLLALLYRKTEEYKYIVNVIKSVFRRFVHGKRFN